MWIQIQLRLFSFPMLISYLLEEISMPRNNLILVQKTLHCKRLLGIWRLACMETMGHTVTGAD